MGRQIKLPGSSGAILLFPEPPFRFQPATSSSLLTHCHTTAGARCHDQFIGDVGGREKERGCGARRARLSRAHLPRINITATERQSSLNMGPRIRPTRLLGTYHPNEL